MRVGEAKKVPPGEGGHVRHGKNDRRTGGVSEIADRRGGRIAQLGEADWLSA